MANPAAAEQALKDGDAQRALQLLTEQVRAHPQDSKLRVFLFQLLCVTGQWERALNQLNVAFELDAGTLPMVQTYREAIACETLRLQVFAGQKVPMLFGEPENWIALLIEAMLRDGRGDADDARRLREQALEQAPPSAGRLD
jgi:type VI secretion system protein ImpE